MVSAIETTQLTKVYQGQKAPSLKDLNLTVERGEIFGYLGPNGAGKTTTIRLLLDLIRPTSGQVKLFGVDVSQESRRARAMVGNLPGELRLWDHMTGRQTLEYMAALRPGSDLTFAYHMAERLNLNLNMRSANYSTGNKRKVGIIQAMMHRPPLLILDEPTTGLDPLVRNTFHDLLLEARDHGQTIFLSSHVLSEVQAVCDRVAVLREGTLRAVEKVDTMQLSIRRIITLYSSDKLVLQDWSGLPGVERVESGAGYVRLHVTGSLDAIIKQAATFTIDDLQVDASKLEDVFMELYHD